MGLVRELMRRIKKVEQLSSEQGALVDREFETKKEMVAKQGEIDREIAALKQTRAYQDAVGRAKRSPA